jgi:hypothetical protein
MGDLSLRRFVQRPHAVAGFVTAQLPLHWRLVDVGATPPLFDGLGVALQREGLFVGDDLLVPMLEGALLRSAIGNHVIFALDERVEFLALALQQEAANRGEEWTGHANLYLDPDVRVGDLVDTIYTLGKHGFISYGFAVTPHSHAQIGDTLVESGLLVSPPKFVAGQQPAPPEGYFTLVVYLGLEQVVLGRQTQATEWVELLAWSPSTMTELERHASDLARQLEQVGFYAPDRLAVVTADPRMSVEAMLQAMSAVVGSTCDFSPDTGPCHFPMLVIEAGGVKPDSQK